MYSAREYGVRPAKVLKLQSILKTENMNGDFWAGGTIVDVWEAGK